jgi:hypothetical protein
MNFLALGAYFLAAGSGSTFGMRIRIQETNRMRIRIRNTDRMNYKVQAYGVDL